MSFAQVAAAVGAVLAICGFIWYKVKHSVQVESDSALKDAEIERAAETQKALEAEIAAKAEQERLKLHEEASKILAVVDVGERVRLALELLARMRGVH